MKRRSERDGVGIWAGRMRFWAAGKFAGIHNYSSGLPIQVNYSGFSIPVGFAPNIRPDVVSIEADTRRALPSHTDFTVGTPYLNPAAFAPPPTTPNGVPLTTGHRASVPAATCEDRIRCGKHSV